MLSPRRLFHRVHDSQEQLPSGHPPGAGSAGGGSPPGDSVRERAVRAGEARRGQASWREGLPVFISAGKGVTMRKLGMATLALLLPIVWFSTAGAGQQEKKEAVRKAVCVLHHTKGSDTH